jgi:hypothetical protein
VMDAKVSEPHVLFVSDGKAELQEEDGDAGATRKSEPLIRGVIERTYLELMERYQCFADAQVCELQMAEQRKRRVQRRDGT